MDFLTNLTDIRTIQWLACTASCVLVFILMLIKVPSTEYAKKISNAKTLIIISFIVFSIMMIYSLNKYNGIWEYERFSSLTMLVSASFSSVAISYSMINLIDEKLISNERFLLNILVLILTSVILLENFTDGGITTVYTASLIVTLVLFIIQSIYYIVIFDKTYKMAANTLNAYYDEDEEHKIKWIRFCYILTMLTNFTLLVYMLLPTGFMKVYILWYVLFMLYFTANFISFIGKHKMILDAFAHRTLSGRDLFNKRHKRTNAQSSDSLEYDKNQKDKAFNTLEKKLAQWVTDKKYREYDKSREEIAAELGTTKEILQLYFTNSGHDFRSWRTELRINDAKKMLLEDKNVSIPLVGELCGFSDRSNFHTQFTKLVGCSPKKWRETKGNPD